MLYTEQDFEKENDNRSLCAMALNNWAVCMAGLVKEVPEDFGRGMAIVSQKLGISVTPDSLSAYADKIIAEK